MHSPEYAVKLLRKCCDRTLKSVKKGTDKASIKEDRAYSRVFEALTGQPPTDKEMRKIFRMEDE